MVVVTGVEVGTVVPLLIDSIDIGLETLDNCSEKTSAALPENFLIPFLEFIIKGCNNFICIIIRKVFYILIHLYLTVFFKEMCIYR